MKQQITFVVPFPPKPKERPRFSGHAYTSKRTRQYEQAVRTAAMRALAEWRMEHGGAHWNAQGPYHLSCFFFMADKRKRDLDNCMKAISDGIEGTLYDKDHQLDEIYAYRDYDPKNPRTVVTVRRLREGELG